MFRKQLLQAGAVVLGLALGAAAHSQTWPAKSVRIIVPFGPGGGTDIQGRLLGRSSMNPWGRRSWWTTAPGRAA